MGCWFDDKGAMVRRREVKRVALHLCTAVLWVLTCLDGKFGVSSNCAEGVDVVRCVRPLRNFLSLTDLMVIQLTCDG